MSDIFSTTTPALASNPIAGKNIYFHNECAASDDVWCADVALRLEHLKGTRLPYFSGKVHIVVHNRCPTTSNEGSVAASAPDVTSPLFAAPGGSVYSKVAPTTTQHTFGRYAKPERLHQLRQNKLCAGFDLLDRAQNMDCQIYHINRKYC
jgi:hypothetical protein